MVPNNLVPTMARLRQENVQMITGARVKKIDAGTIIADTKKGEMKYPGFTHVICAVGSKAWNPLYEENICDRRCKRSGAGAGSCAWSI